jgi:hypothetical protein
MAGISSHYNNLRELFVDYPLAVRADDAGEDGETLRSMVLMVPGRPKFFVLRLLLRNDRPVYSVGLWPTGDFQENSADDNAPVSDTLANALTQGVPIPRDGSLFGWIHGDVVTALIVVYASESQDLVPSWAIMPLAGAPEWQWPPFSGERLFGSWFWKHYRAGEIVCLGNSVAENPGAVFWVDTKAALGSDCCLVKRGIGISAGYTLPRGCYVYIQALREGRQVPPLEQLEGGNGNIDLAAWYDRSSCEGS